MFARDKEIRESEPSLACGGDVLAWIETDWTFIVQGFD